MLDYSMQSIKVTIVSLLTPQNKRNNSLNVTRRLRCVTQNRFNNVMNYRTKNYVKREKPYLKLKYIFKRGNCLPAGKLYIFSLYSLLWGSAVWCHVCMSEWNVWRPGQSYLTTPHFNKCIGKFNFALLTCKARLIFYTTLFYFDSRCVKK